MKNCYKDNILIFLSNFGFSRLLSKTCSVNQTSRQQAQGFGGQGTEKNLAKNSSEWSKPTWK